MCNQEKVAKISGCLIELFPEHSFEQERKINRGVNSFYIRPNKNQQYILTVTDECLMDHDIEKILGLVSSNKQLIVESEGKELVLYTSLQFAVNDI